MEASELDVLGPVDYLVVEFPADKANFKGEIAAVAIAQKKGDPLVVAQDESPRADASPGALAKLNPVFRKGGTVTAGNSSPLNDGASAVMVVSEDVLRAEGLDRKSVV